MKANRQLRYHSALALLIAGALVGALLLVACALAPVHVFIAVIPATLVPGPIFATAGSVRVASPLYATVHALSATAPRAPPAA